MVDKIAASVEVKRTEYKQILHTNNTTYYPVLRTVSRKNFSGARFIFGNLIFSEMFFSLHKLNLDHGALNPFLYLPFERIRQLQRRNLSVH
jgi:hypothetical protein